MGTNFIKSKEQIVTAIKKCVEDGEEKDLKYLMSRLKLDTGLKQKVIEEIFTDLENVKEISLDWEEGVVSKYKE